MIGAAKPGGAHSSSAHVRASVQRFFVLSVRELSAWHVIAFGAFLPTVVEALNDRGAEVREAAVAALEMMYDCCSRHNFVYRYLVLRFTPFLTWFGFVGLRKLVLTLKNLSFD